MSSCIRYLISSSGLLKPLPRMASQVLKRNLDRLARVLDPVPVATQLYSDSLITQEVWDEARELGPAYTRNLKVLDALGKAVLINERAFDRFLDNLRGEQTYLPYVMELEGIIKFSDVYYTISHTTHTHTHGTAQLAQAREKAGVKPKTADVPGARRRDDAVDDATLMSIARDVGPKWEEMGVVLGADIRALRNEVPSDGTKGEHMKAFYMLQLCRHRDAEAFTYDKIAAALEDVGLKSCARKHCFTIR